MRFSVVIATCGRPERLAKCLDYLRECATTCPGSEVIVVDNHPSTSARESIAPFHDAIPIRHLKTTPFNKAVALNAGIAAASNEWLAFTDDDCLPDKDWLSSAGAFAEKQSFRVFGGRVDAPRPDFDLPRWLQAGASGNVPGGASLVRYMPLPQSGALPPSCCAPIGANFFARQCVFKELGLYDEDLWARCGRYALGSEDGEMGIRLHARGEPIGYCREALVLHPIYRERAVLSNHLAYAFAFGVREPLLPGLTDIASIPFLCRAAVKAMAQSLVSLCRRDYAASVWRLQHAVMRLGNIAAQSGAVAVRMPAGFGARCAPSR